MNDTPGPIRACHISVVIPVYNEEATLDALVGRCVSACDSIGESYEIILVDDGSTDSSRSKIQAATEQHAGKIIGVILSRNYGQHSAVMAGLAESRGEIIVTLDADLQNLPEEIPRLVQKIMEGFDAVGSVRVPREDSLLRTIPSRLVNITVQRVTGVMMHDYGCMLRAYRRHIVDAMLQCHERSTFIPVLANTFARNSTEIEVGHAKRPAGDSKYNIWKLINLQFDLLTSITTMPLRLLSIAGILISLLGVGFGLFLLVMRLIHGPEWAVEGVFTLFAILFIFIGGQFIGMGLLGEYLGRVYQDVRARPRYSVHQTIGRQVSSQPRSDAESADAATERKNT
jgi:undecaprenyl-phosphate 4-deoxy-4-formamido-L-arabinose transferase